MGNLTLKTDPKLEAGWLIDVVSRAKTVTAHKRTDVSKIKMAVLL